MDEYKLGKNLLSLGIIFIELITNSLKYAFKESNLLEIQARLYKDQEFLVFEYSDNGSGDIELKKEGYGMILFATTAKQFKGDFSLFGERTFRFRFLLSEIREE